MVCAVRACWGGAPLIDTVLAKRQNQPSSTSSVANRTGSLSVHHYVLKEFHAEDVSRRVH